MTKADKFKTLKETDFQKEVIKPLMERMGYSHVRITHGTEEFGKDVIGHIKGPFGSSITVVVAKAVDISGRTGQATYQELLATIDRQIQQAFDMPIEDPTRPSHESEQFAAKVIVWTSGKITGNSRKLILKQRNSKYRNVEFVDGDKTLDLLEEYYPEYFTIGDAEISNYIVAAKNTNSRLVELHMLGSSDEKRGLSQMFVSPTLRQVIPEKLRSKQSKIEGKTTEKVEYNEIFTKLNKNTALIGGMGSGKTTLLRRILIDTIERNESAGNKFPIPILIRFRDIEIDKPLPIFSALETEYKDLCPNATRSIKQDLTDGNILALIDGLDEIDERETRFKMIEIMDTFTKSYPKTVVVITSRQDDVLANNPLPEGFTTYKLIPMSVVQISDLISNWFRLNDDTASRLIRLITEPVTMSALQATPLTIALVASIFESNNRDFPTNLTELFEQYVELALGRWDRGREINSQIDWRIKSRVLSKVCWNMLKSSDVEVPLDSIRNQIESYAAEKGLSIDVDRFYKETVERSGLLIKTSDNKVEFIHRAFRDYFAGVEIAAKENASEIIVDHYYDRPWSTPIFFAFGTILEADTQVRKILEQVPVIEGRGSEYGWNLGLIGQAAYLMDADTKVELVKKSISALVDSWDHVTQQINQHATDTQNIIPHMFLLMHYSLFTQIAVGSSSLGSALKQVADECKIRENEIDDMNSYTRAIAELYTYTVAMACAHAGELSSFVELFKTTLIKDPGLYFVAKREIEEIIESKFYLGSDVSLKDLEEILKKLNRSIGNNQVYISQLIREKPLSLPSSSAE